MKTQYPIILGAVMLLAVAGSCRRESGDEQSRRDVLVEIGDSALTLHDVVDQIPAGLSRDDSTALFNALVDDWVREMLLSEVAMRNVSNSEKIERLVKEYRNTLIVNEYRQQMQSNRTNAPSEDEIRAYYLRNSGDMLLERPLVKGIYIKLPSDAEQIGRVRKWVRSAKKTDVDKLEKYGLKEAMQYDWFGDQWVDWQTIADQIPYRFSDPDQFVRSHSNFETERNGSIYLLHIYSYLKSGSPMPYDFARTLITEILSAGQNADYDRMLVRSLYEKGVKEGLVKPVGFDPSTHKKIINKNLDKK